MEKFGGGSRSRTHKSLLGMEVSRSKTVPAWALLSLVTNGVLIFTVVQLLLRGHNLTESFQANDAVKAEAAEEQIGQPVISAKAVLDVPVPGAT